MIISEELLQIYGFIETKKYYTFSSDIFYHDVKHVKYRNIYNDINFQDLINSISHIDYDRTKYIWDYTDIMSGYDNNLVYNISYNVYKHLLPIYNDIKYDPEMMYIYSLRDNDIIGMKYVFPMINKSKLDMEILDQTIGDSRVNIAWKQFILDMGNTPPDLTLRKKKRNRKSKKSIYTSRIYDNLINYAIENNVACILVAMEKIKYVIGRKKYIQDIRNDPIDSFIIAYNNDYIYKDDIIRSCVNYYKFNIVKWVVLNTNHKITRNNIRVFNYINKQTKNQLHVSLSYSMKIEKFISEFKEIITLDSMRLICPHHNLSIENTIKILYNMGNKQTNVNVIEHDQRIVGTFIRLVEDDAPLNYVAGVMAALLNEHKVSVSHKTPPVLRKLFEIMETRYYDDHIRIVIEAIELLEEKQKYTKKDNGQHMRLLG